MTTNNASRLLFGTGNEAKITAMRGHLANLNIEIIGLKDLPILWPEVPEEGTSPLENARVKAHAYYKLYKNPVFSCDTGLEIEGLKAEEQPGVNVRTREGKRLSDEEMMVYYTAIAKKMGGKCVARYRNAICLILDEEHCYEYMGDDLCSQDFYLVSEARKQKEKGFPLDAFSIEIESGSYYYDLDKPLVDSLDIGFENFFRRALGDFIK